MPFPSPAILILTSALTVLNSLHVASAETNVSIRARTGDVSSVAAGENAHTSIQLGSIPSQNRQGCVDTKIKLGEIQKIVLGKNARVIVEFPPVLSNGKEKNP